MKKITGVMVYYYFICHKRLWYFANGLNMEKGNPLVAMGKLIDETSYKDGKKHIMIGEMVNIDFLEDWKVIHEIKKSDKLEEASIWQLKYYIYILKNKDVGIEKGVLDYPKLRKRKDVYFDIQDEVEMERILKDIGKIIARKLPGLEKKKPYCKKCAYYEFCFI